MLISLVASLRNISRLAGLRKLGSLHREAGRAPPDMAGRVVSIENAEHEDLERVVQETSSVLRGGGVVAIPTDTIYGVASLVSSDEGVERIYKMKGRQRDKPLAICVSEVEQVYRWAKVTVPSSLLSRLLPGPVTAVFERGTELNPALNPGVSLVGLRIPDHSFVRRLVDCSGGPLALTSANISQTSSTLSIQEFRELWPSLDLVVDGGVIEGSNRLGSTVVDLSRSGTFSIIRPGTHHQQTVELLRDQYNLKEMIT